MSQQNGAANGKPPLQEAMGGFVKRLVEAQLEMYGQFGLMDPADIYGGMNDWADFFPGGPIGVARPFYIDNQGRGEVLPVYRTERELKLIRDRSRRLCAENSFAISALENRKNYAVGKGLQFRATGDDPEMVRRCQLVIDAFAAANDLPAIEADGMERLDRDGELIIRFFEGGGGLLTLRTVEPEFVRAPNGEAFDPRDSFGFRSLRDDVETIEGMWVAERPWINPSVLTYVPSDEFLHVKLNTPKNAKRGLPTFFAVESELRMADDLLKSMVTMAKARAKYAVIRKLTNIAQTAAQNLVNSLTDVTLTNPMTGQTRNIEHLPYGSVLTADKNTEYDFPSGNVGGADYVAVLDAVLRAIAARLNMPEFMLSANASNANYSSTFIAEAPSTRSFERLQQLLKQRFGEDQTPNRESAVWRQLLYAVRLGILPPAIRQKIKVQCEAPSLIVRNKSEEATCNEKYLKMGIKSPQTISQEQGLDHKQESDNFRAIGVDPVELMKKALTSPPPQQPGQPGEKPPVEAPAPRGVKATEARLAQLRESYGDAEAARIKDAATELLALEAMDLARLMLRESHDVSDEKRDEGGQWTSGGGSDSHPGAANGSTVKVKKVKTRAFDGTPAALKTTLTKQETGRVGEAVSIAYLKTILGRKDARPMNTKKTNFPVDALEDHKPTEIKAGLASNSRKAQQWRLTFSKESPAEKKLYESMTPAERKEWNIGKQQRIHERKQKVIKQLEKETGKKITPRTMTCILNPDTKTADVYIFEGLHDRIDWQSDMAKKGYHGTVSYG